MSSAPLVPARLNWPSAIGNFLLNFGTLDYLVFVFSKDNLSPDEFTKVKELHLKERVNRITRLLKDEQYPAEQQAAFARLVDRLDSIRELRNHIAHGHLYLRLDSETQKPIVSVFRSKDLDTGLLADAKHLEFAELCAAAKTLSELIEEFEQLAGFKE